MHYNSISDTNLYSNIFVVQLSFSLSVQSNNNLDNIIKSEFISLKKHIGDIKSTNPDIPFINIENLKTEGYWDDTTLDIPLFNKEIKDGGKKKEKRIANLVSIGLEHGDNIFLKKSITPYETTKMFSFALSARSYRYHYKQIKNIKRLFLGEIETVIEGINFVIVPCITLWDNDTESYGIQFITINLFIFSSTKSGSKNPETISKIIAKFSHPKSYQIQILTSEKEIDYTEIKPETEYYLFDFLKFLTTDVCNLFKTKLDDLHKFNNMMVSVTLDLNANDKLYFVPDYSINKKLYKEDIDISHIIFDYIYGFWVNGEYFSSETYQNRDFSLKIKDNLIIYLPQDFVFFFNQSRHFSLNIPLSLEKFPNRSSIWAISTEMIIDENISIQQYMISWYNHNTIQISKNEEYEKIQTIRRSNINDFEPFYNMNTDDYIFKNRIELLQSKLGIDKKYHFMKQCLDNLTTISTENQNQLMQTEISELTFNLTFLTWLLFILGVLNLVFLAFETDNDLKLFSVIIGIIFCFLGFFFIKIFVKKTFLMKNIMDE